MVGLVFGLALLAAGLGLVLYPVVSGIIAQGEVDQALEAWRSDVEISDSPATGGTAYRSKDGDPTYEKLLAYNEAVRAGTGDAVNDPFAFNSEDLAELGLPDGIIGSVRIDRLGETIPLYLGATQANLAHGGGVIAGTSMPTGGEGTACAIAVHRGACGGLPMMRDVETMVPGDLVVVETPWDTLTYRMVRSEVITPNDTAALAVEEGKDTLTLLTCHPYGHNYQRYLVRCERVEDDGSEAGSQRTSLAASVAHAVWPGWSPGSPLLNVESILRLAGIAVAVLLGVWLLVDGVRSHRRGGSRRG